MKKGITLFVVSCFMVLSLVLASSAPAGKEGKAAGPEMVKIKATKIDGTVVEKMAEKPKYGGVLRQCSSTGPLSFDNALRHISVCETLHLTNETLLKGDWAKGPQGTGEAGWLYNMMPARETLAGCLAESWEFTDSNTIVFHIRKGVHWHDKPPTNGREMTADDVLHTLKHLMRTSTSVYFNDDTKYFESFESIVMPDKWTIVMKCRPGTIGTVFERYVSFMRVLPHDALEQYGNMGEWKNSIGTGAFMLTDYVPESAATFVRNPAYWMKDPLHPANQLPYVDGIKLFIIPDVSTRIAALRTAKVDYHVWVAWEEAASLLKTTPELKHLKYPGLTVSALCWRVDKPELPWSDLRVRRALSMAVDMKKIADTYYGGQADLLAWPAAPIPEHKDMYTPIGELPEESREVLTYNSEKAKQLLTAAGYPGGFKAEVLCHKDYVDILSIVKDYWAKVGVDLTLDVKEYGTYTSMLYGRTYKQMVMASLGSYYPLSFYYSVPMQAWNYSEINDPRLNEAYKVVWDKYLDEPFRQKTMKETIPYELGQAYKLLFPGAHVYNFWWPWLKGYSGERIVGFYHLTDMQQYVWLDQALREKMAGG